MSKKRFLLKPELSARENLFEAATSACTYLLNCKRLKLLYEERQELLLELTISTIENFLYHKVFLKKYDRRYSFWNNVYASAWGVSMPVINKYLNQIKFRLNSTSTACSPLDNESTIEDTLVWDPDQHPLEHDHEPPYNKQSERRYGETYHEALKRIWADQDAEMEVDGFAHDYYEIERHRNEILGRVRQGRHRGRDSQQNSEKREKRHLSRSEYVRDYRARRKAADPAWWENYCKREAERGRKSRAKAKAAQNPQNPQNPQSPECKSQQQSTKRTAYLREYRERRKAADPAWWEDYLKQERERKRKEREAAKANNPQIPDCNIKQSEDHAAYLREYRARRKAADPAWWEAYLKQERERGRRSRAEAKALHQDQSPECKSQHQNTGLQQP